MKYKWVLVHVIERLTPAAVYEHTPYNYYKTGEYPRFLRPVGVHAPRLAWGKLYDDGRIVTYSTYS